MSASEIGADVDIYRLWLFHGETLRDRYEALKKTESDPVMPVRLGHRYWLKDIREDGDLFYTEVCFRFLLQLCKGFCGSLDDNDVFSPVARVMRLEKLKHLYFACASEQVRNDLKRREFGLIVDLDDEPPKAVLRALWAHPKSRAKFKCELSVWLQYAVEMIRKWQAESPDSQKDRFEELRRLFSLSDREIDVLLLSALIATRFWPCEDFKLSASCNTPLVKRAALLGMTTAEYLTITKPTANLRRLGCLDSDGDPGEQIGAFLSGVDDTPLASRYFKKNEISALPWSFFGTLSDTHGAFLKRMIAGRASQKGINILLYGEPGTGKTSFALALAQELGYAAYLITQADDSKEGQRNASNAFRFAALQVCDKQVSSEKSLVIIDEADAMLERQNSISQLFGVSGSSDGKGLLNDVLDSVRVPCVWITNSSEDALDASNRRRFDYSIRFNKLTTRQRALVWKNGVAKHGVADMVPSGLVSRLVSRYEVNAGGIDLALRNLGAMLKSGTVGPDDAGMVLDTVLASHAQLLNVKANGANEVGLEYSLEGLSIRGDVSPAQVEGAVRRFQEEQVVTDNDLRDTPRMNLLLSGPPGTGKTEFVKYLGKVLDTHVITKMGSDLLNMYIGGTEKNIRRVFSEAEAERGILFLDEVDGLIQSRSRASHTWEVTQVNELLHRMENFNGVLVCATNFADCLDAAVLRRFTFKLEFDYLTEEGKIIFFNRLFSPLGVNSLSADESKRLRRISALTPGDYRTVRQELYYLGGNITATMILERLERESLAKRIGVKTVGFR